MLHKQNLWKQQEELFYLELALSKTTTMPCSTAYAFVERVPLVVLKSFCLCGTISNFKWFFIQQENRVIIQLIYGERNQIIPSVQRYIITYALSWTKPKFIRQMCLIANNCKTLHALVIIRHASMIDIHI